MFTGIVQHVGEVRVIRPLSDNSISVDVDCRLLNMSSKLGDSICVDGVCLTVEKKNEEFLRFTAISETLKLTKMSKLVPGSPVNVEKSASFQDLVGGHVITGHIDTTGKVINVKTSDNWKVIKIEAEVNFSNLLIRKGSVCIDGVSLTVSDRSEKTNQFWFEVSLVPATLRSTNLDNLVDGSRVNIEFDQVAKYIARNIKENNGQ